MFTTDPAVIAEAVRYLRIAAISQLGVCAEIVLEGALGGAGATLPPMLTSTVITAMPHPAGDLGGGAVGDRRDSGGRSASRRSCARSR